MNTPKYFKKRKIENFLSALFSSNCSSHSYCQSKTTHTESIFRLHHMKAYLLYNKLFYDGIEQQQEIKQIRLLLLLLKYTHSSRQLNLPTQQYHLLRMNQNHYKIHDKFYSLIMENLYKSIQVRISIFLMPLSSNSASSMLWTTDCHKTKGTNWSLTSCHSCAILTSLKSYIISHYEHVDRFIYLFLNYTLHLKFPSKVPSKQLCYIDVLVWVGFFLLFVWFYFRDYYYY